MKKVFNEIDEWPLLLRGRTSVALQASVLTRSWPEEAPQRLLCSFNVGPEDVRHAHHPVSDAAVKKMRYDASAPMVIWCL